MAATEFPQTPESTEQRPRRRRRPPVWALLVALAVIGGIAVAAVLLLSNDDDNDKVVLGKPRIVSPGELSAYAHKNGRTIYWAGPAAQGFKLELTEVTGRRVFVRYLQSSVQAGDPRPAFTAIGTYPMPDAFTKLRASSSRPGAVTGQLAGGGMTLYYKKTPSNVYVARPGSNFLVEVFAPQPRGALQIAGSPSLVQVP
jgi:hypothetical protein